MFRCVCVVCHMQAASPNPAYPTQGVPQNHFFRISVDPNYYTFPTAAQFYQLGSQRAKHGYRHSNRVCRCNLESTSTSLVANAMQAATVRAKTPTV